MALRDVAQLGSAPALGAGCRRFESCHPDLCVVILGNNIPMILLHCVLMDFQLKKYPKVSCGAGILPANHQGRASCPSHKIG